MTNLERDQQLIADLGGPAKVAELLNLKKAGGVQRVQNWTTRGIPALVKVNFPQYFMRNGKRIKAAEPAKAG